ncbi:MAG: STAS domain-containing protein [Oscillospiraceae bacterium]|jgi:anti-sigma B factor antagonist|nr:STAS domain-containing protein [Oscillospiraceae bacterium]
MTITKTESGTVLLLELEGRLDTLTAKELEAENSSSLSGKTEVTYDFAKLDYVSSAGLRVILAAYKELKKTGSSFKLIHVSDEIKEVFEMTGFSDFLTIE